MDNVQKIAGATVGTSLLGSLLIYAFDALILIWVCGILLPIFPALAVLAGLTYWDWVGILFGLNVVARQLAKIFKAVWAR